MMADPEYSCFVINLRAEDASFELRSDEEGRRGRIGKEEGDSKKKKDKDSDKQEDGDGDANAVTIDFEGIEARTIAIPMKTARYSFRLPGRPGASLWVNGSPMAAELRCTSSPSRTGLALHGEGLALLGVGRWQEGHRPDRRVLEAV